MDSSRIGLAIAIFIGLTAPAVALPWCHEIKNPKADNNCLDHIPPYSAAGMHQYSQLQTGAFERAYEGYETPEASKYGGIAGRSSTAKAVRDRKEAEREKRRQSKQKKNVTQAGQAEADVETDWFTCQAGTTCVEYLISSPSDKASFHAKCPSLKPGQQCGGSGCRHTAPGRVSVTFDSGVNFEEFKRLCNENHGQME